MTGFVFFFESDRSGPISISPFDVDASHTENGALVITNVLSDELSKKQRISRKN